MGYSTRNGGQITDFWPDDTDVEFYVAHGASMDEIMERCREKWPDPSAPLGFNPSSIRIDSEFIHTDCLGYDLMDWGDYTKFLKITKIS